jgi:hypothetical protein
MTLVLSELLKFWPYVWNLDPGHTYDEHSVLAFKSGVTVVPFGRSYRKHTSSPQRLRMQPKVSCQGMRTTIETWTSILLLWVEMCMIVSHTLKLLMMFDLGFGILTLLQRRSSVVVLHSHLMWFLNRCRWTTADNPGLSAVVLEPLLISIIIIGL